MVDLVHSQWHLSCLQEIQSHANSTALARQRGIERLYDPTLSCAIMAGGPGRKAIYSLYGPCEEHSFTFPRHWAPDDAQFKTAAWFIVGAVGAVNPLTWQLIPRGGKDYWKVASVHYNNKWAKKPDDVDENVSGFFRLAFRDKINIISGDWNQAHHKTIKGLATCLY